VENDENYLEGKNTKLEIYNREQLQLIEITKSDLKNLKEYLTEKLRLFDVFVQ
jgi:predicted AAA+ superfamily ATPase